MIIFLIILILLAIVFYMIYAGLIQARNKVKEALSGVDVQLKKRHDVIPNILTLAAKYMKHEKELLTQITELRVQALNADLNNSDQISQKLDLENQLQGKLDNLMINAENYPSLKASETFMAAMNSYNDVEEHIAASRRFYNAAVNDLKNRVEIFPGNVVASIVGVKADMPFFEATEAERKEVNAKDYFK